MTQHRQDNEPTLDDIMGIEEGENAEIVERFMKGEAIAGYSGSLLSRRDEAQILELSQAEEFDTPPGRVAD